MTCSNGNGRRGSTKEQLKLRRLLRVPAAVANKWEKLVYVNLVVLDCLVIILVLLLLLLVRVQGEVDKAPVISLMLQNFWCLDFPIQIWRVGKIWILHFFFSFSFFLVLRAYKIFMLFLSAFKNSKSDKGLYINMYIKSVL